jgi:hypothetical protein
MREELKKLKDSGRLIYIGRVERFGTKPGYEHTSIPTVLLKDIECVNTGIIVTDHIWLTVRKRLSAAHLEIGDYVRFKARVTPYLKGYVNSPRQIDNRKTDYRLSYPTDIEKIIHVVAYS